MKRVTTILGMAFVVMLAAVTSAFAHVTANPTEQPAGGFTKVEFRVPNERDVPTTKVDIQVPEGVDFVSVQPVPGWTFEIKKVKLDKPAVAEDGDEVTDRISEIVFSGGEINAGEFQSFYVGMKLPEQGEVDDYLFFPTLQTYEGGEVVKWVEKPASGEDPFSLEKPSPFVTLTKADDSTSDDAATSSAASADLGKYAKQSDVDDKDKQLSVLGIAALALSIVALVLAMRGRKRD